MKKTVILLSGKMRSGKNQLAEYLAEYIKEQNLGSVEFEMFAGDLKNGAYKDFQRLSNIFKEEYEKILKKYPTDKYLINNLEWMNVKKEHFFEDKTIYTRAILQIYGTNIFGNRVDQNYWAKRVLKKVENSSANFILVTDTRFPNEIELLSNNKDFNTVVIRVERDTGIECDHASETSLDEYLNWDLIVDNNHSLEILKESAKSIIKEILTDLIQYL